jgi:glycolate oxidase FAD binding subunit
MIQTALARPRDSADLVALVDAARADGARLALCGGGTKAAFGAEPTGRVTAVDMRGLAGIVDYDPAELVLTVRPGTPLAEVETLLAAHGQMLAFEPFDHGPIHGMAAGAATIGGVIAAGIAGSRRLSRGGARDHLLGFSAVSGRGEAFVAGAKVTKNVTGYDLPKIACGSWGRLFALTELHVKTLPRAPMQQTLVIDGLSPAAAVAVMSRASGSQASVAAAAHDPQAGLTALRLEGFAASVAARRALLNGLLADTGAPRVLDDAAADVFWQGFGTIAALADAPLLWRVIVPAGQAPGLIVALEHAGEQAGARWLMDWAGGLLWVGTRVDGGIRALVEAAGGHADLVRANADVRAHVPARHPPTAGVAALEARVRRAFDPDGVFETGRFGIF